MQATREDTFNVMVLSLAIISIVIIGSAFLLWALTRNAYLDSYFILETLFEAQNTAAGTDLAAVAFMQSPGMVGSLLVIVVVDSLSRILIVSFIIAAVIDFLNYANIEGVINNFKARAYRDHVIICGFNEIAERLCKKLDGEHTRYVVVDPRKYLRTERYMQVELNERGILSIEGDFTKEETLRAASIGNARAIAFVSESDLDNVVGAIVARRINPKIKIESRLSDERIRRRVYAMGTDMAVIPENLAGIEMGDYISRLYGARNG